LSDAIRTHPTAVATISAAGITKIVRLGTIVAIVNLVTASAAIVVAVGAAVEETADQNKRSGNQSDGPFADNTQSIADTIGAAAIAVVSITLAVTSLHIVSAAVGVTGTGTAVDIVDALIATTGWSATIRSNHAAALTAEITIAIARAVASTTDGSEKRQKQAAEK